MEQLTKHMKKHIKDEGKVDDTISMSSLLKAKPDYDDKDEEDFLKLHNNDYLDKAREAAAAEKL